MNAGFLGCLTGACLMGMSCGTGCSPVISVFLSSYIFHNGGDSKNSFFAFLSFFAGKAGAVILVCSTASLLQMALVGENGYFGKYSLSHLMPVFLILSGIYLLWKSLKESRTSGICSCHGSCGYQASELFRQTAPLIGGFFYGLTPCVPLVLLAGYSVAMTLPQAMILGTAFSAACMISPLCFLLILMKLTASRIREELPRFFQMTKVLLSMAVLITGMITFFTGIEPLAA